MVKSVDTIREMLEAPFAPEMIRQRQGANGMMLSYVDGATVFRRLNEACNQWSFETDDMRIEEMYTRNGEVERVMVVTGHLIIPELGKRPGTGVQVIKPGGGEDQFKAAQTDAIKKAATLFGVALHLYEDRPMHNTSTVSPLQGTTEQQAPQGGQPQYQRATGDRVPGGATVRQINQIQKTAGVIGMSPEELAGFVSELGGTPDLNQLNSRAASTVISALFAEEKRMNEQGEAVHEMNDVSF